MKEMVPVRELGKIVTSEMNDMIIWSNNKYSKLQDLKAHNNLLIRFFFIIYY